MSTTHRIILATGIYPPDIGGPATYVRHLAQELYERGWTVVVVTYGKLIDKHEPDPPWQVIRVPRTGGPLLRWLRYSRVLRREGKNADVVYAFSAVSCGVPLWMAGLKHPRRILRLGGDFLWERYTDIGGHRGLRQFYARYKIVRWIMAPILRHFHHIIFSTSYQENLYRRIYRRLPAHSVVENALASLDRSEHTRHTPLKLLFLGRFVRFKNLPALLMAVASLPYVHLTLVGDGPVAAKASELARKLSLQGRVSFLTSVHGIEKDQLFREHDLLVLPSFTEISPNTALEARAAGLPVLLTEENGLSEALSNGMMVRELHHSPDIVKAVIEADQHYEEIAKAAAAPFPERPWSMVADEHLALFRSLLRDPTLP